MRIGSNYYNTDIQVWAMKNRFPQFKAKRKEDNEIEFTGDLIVKPEFPVYTVSILYQGDFRPYAKVINPILVEEPPHYYKQSKTLCLYNPKYYHWCKEKLIAKDIVAWTAAWIYFYEVWLKEKKWYGPEAHDVDLSILENN